jgi:hypothetical protein
MGALWHKLSFLHYPTIIGILLPQFLLHEGADEMTEKIASKHLINLQSQFAIENPVLQNAIKVFHELDQFEFDLGLIENDDTTAIQTSWWSTVSVVGGNSGAKEAFLARYFNAELSPTHKTTVFIHSPQANQTILPATALDVDYRYPFYRVSQKLEQIQKGEGEKINANLEMRTLNSPRLQGKLFIDIPNFIHATNYEVSNFLTTYSMEQSDVVLVFCDIFNTASDLAKALTKTLVLQQESNKLVYLFDDTTSGAAAWQKKLADLGLTIGQFIGISQLENPSSADFRLLEQRIANAGLQRSYRVLHSLEKSIDDVENVVMFEVKQSLSAWKDRSTFSSLIILGFLSMLALIMEVEMGFLELLLDPIIGSAIILMTIGFMIPTHVLLSKLQAKFEIRSLEKRQKRLHLTENLVAVFEQNLTFSLIMLPTSEPVIWNKKTKAQLSVLRNKAKELVQSLNDNFSLYSTVVTSAPVVQVAPKPVLQPEAVFVAPPAPQPVAVEPVPVAQTQPQRKSALMQKFTRK